mgnify:CR=1 FL=1
MCESQNKEYGMYSNQKNKCEKDEKASFLALPYLQKGWLGSNNHPGIISHRAAKECLVDKIREIRGINA